jgi:hypothetical protein
MEMLPALPPRWGCLPLCCQPAAVSSENWSHTNVWDLRVQVYFTRGSKFMFGSEGSKVGSLGVGGSAWEPDVKEVARMSLSMEGDGAFGIATSSPHPFSMKKFPSAVVSVTAELQAL